MSAGPTARGKRTTNSLPLPGPPLEAVTDPLWSSTRRRTSVRPIPSPPCARSSDRSACTNMSKMYGSTSGAIPMPVSRTATTTPSSLALASTTIVPPASMYLALLFRRFENTCASRVRSASSQTGSSGWRICKVCR